ALAQAPPDERIRPELGKAVEHARRKAAEHQATLEARLSSAIPATLDPRARARAERFVSNASRRTRHFHQEPTHFHYPGLPEIEFHDREQFQELDVLEAATSVILKEFEELIAA